LGLSYLNVCRLCVPNIVSLGICFKKLHLVKVDRWFICMTVSDWINLHTQCPEKYKYKKYQPTVSNKPGHNGVDSKV